MGDDFKIRVLGNDRRVYEAHRHYTINDVKGPDTLDFIRSFFANGPDELNWLFLATSGVHGSYLNLDELEAAWDSPQHALAEGFIEDLAEHEKWRAGECEITFTIFCPRMVKSYYGNALIRSKEDFAWLRDAVRKTAAAIAESQKGCAEILDPQLTERAAKLQQEVHRLEKVNTDLRRQLAKRVPKAAAIDTGAAVGAAAARIAELEEDLEVMRNDRDLAVQAFQAERDDAIELQQKLEGHPMEARVAALESEVEVLAHWRRAEITKRRLRGGG
jgi:hypothetical protein